MLGPSGSQGAGPSRTFVERQAPRTSGRTAFPKTFPTDLNGTPLARAAPVRGDTCGWRPGTDMPQIGPCALVDLSLRGPCLGGPWRRCGDMGCGGVWRRRGHGAAGKYRPLTLRLSPLSLRRLGPTEGEASPSPASQGHHGPAKGSQEGWSSSSLFPTGHRPVLPCPRRAPESPWP